MGFGSSEKQEKGGRASTEEDVRVYKFISFN